MKKNLFTRVLSLVLALLMVFALVACAPAVDNKDTNPSDAEGNGETKPREHVTLIMYTHGVNQPGREDMIEALNKYLKEKLNVTLDLRPNKDYTKTMSTRIDAGEDWDICLVGHGVDFKAYAGRNAFAPLTDYLDLLPKTTEQLNQSGYAAFTMDEEVYAVPIMKDSFLRLDALMNQTMLDDLGIEFPAEWKTKRDLVDFFYAVRKAKDAKYPDEADIPLIQDIYLDLSQWIYTETILGTRALPVLSVNIDESIGCKGIPIGDTVFCPFYTQEYRDTMKAIYGLVEAGVGAFDPKAFDQDGVLLNSGKLLGKFGSSNLYVAEDSIPGQKTVFYPSSVIYAANYKVGWAVNAKCKNIERAVEVLEFLQNDTYAATILRFGPEGKGWTDTNNDNVIELSDANSDPTNRYWYMWPGWQVGGVTASKVLPGLPADYMERMKTVNKTAVPTPNFSFVFDVEPVENQVAACNNVISKYHDTLKLGQNSNVDALIDQFIAELKANGMDEIVAEGQRQLTAWRAENGK